MCAERKRRVLILGDDVRSFLAVVRSLGRQGILVDVAPFDFSSSALASRYISYIHRLPEFDYSPNEWQKKLKALIENRGYEMVIPCDERSIIPMMLFKEDIGVLTKIALPSQDAFEIFFDKYRTRQKAED